MHAPVQRDGVEADPVDDVWAQGPRGTTDGGVMRGSVPVLPFTARNKSRQPLIKHKPPQPPLKLPHL